MLNQHNTMIEYIGLPLIESNPHPITRFVEILEDERVSVVGHLLNVDACVDIVERLPESVNKFTLKSAA